MAKSCVVTKELAVKAGAFTQNTLFFQKEKHHYEIENLQRMAHIENLSLRYLTKNFVEYYFIENFAQRKYLRSILLEHFREYALHLGGNKCEYTLLRG